MENCKPTQAYRVLEYIKTFGSITQLEALRDLGYPIESEIVTVRNRFEEKCYIKSYRLGKEQG